MTSPNSESDDLWGAFVERFPTHPEEVALAVKDNFAIRGFRPTAGIAGGNFPVADRDAFVVARWRSHGRTLLGRTRMDEGALGATGDNPAHGRTENPRAPGCSPGGSSCGSAAAVAGGSVRVALGTDTMGSVRIPASYCGVVGFKPSAGILSRSGVVPLSPTLDHVGLLASDMQALRDAFAVLAAHDPEDPASRRLPPRAFQSSGSPAPVEAVIAVLRDPAGAGVEPEVTAAFQRTRGILEREGMKFVELDNPPFFGATLRKAAFLVAEVEGAAVYSRLLEDPGSGLSPAFRRLLTFGRDLSAERREAAYETCRRLAGEAREAFRRCDFIMTPTTPQRAFRHGEPPPANQADMTVIANAAGLPAISLPMPTWSGAQARPTGLQIIGPDLADEAVLSIASAVETALKCA